MLPTGDLTGLIFGDWPCSRSLKSVVTLDWDRIVGLKRHNFFREESLVQELVHLFRLLEVLVVDIAGSCRVNPYEVVFALVLEQCVTVDLSEARVERRYLINSLLFLLIADPVIRITPTPDPFIIINDDTVLGRRC